MMIALAAQKKAQMKWHWREHRHICENYSPYDIVKNNERREVVKVYTMALFTSVSSPRSIVASSPHLGPRGPPRPSLCTRPADISAGCVEPFGG